MAADASAYAKTESSSWRIAKVDRCGSRQSSATFRFLETSTTCVPATAAPTVRSFWKLLGHVAAEEVLLGVIRAAIGVGKNDIHDPRALNGSSALPDKA